MYFLYDKHSMNENRHTITLNSLAFQKLREVGRFSEGYSDLVLRLVDFYRNTAKCNGEKKI